MEASWGVGCGQAESQGWSAGVFHCHLQGAAALAHLEDPRRVPAEPP